MEHKEDKVETISSSDPRLAKIRELLTCPICKKLLREVTTIDECLHKFCKKCITRKITVGRLRNCPVCKVDLGVYPLQKLRADYRWQSIRKVIKFKRQQLNERGLIQGKVKKTQASEEAKEPEVLPSHSLPLKRKEKSISSVLSAEKSSTKRSPVNARRKSAGGRKALPRRRASGVLSIEEPKDDHQTSGSPVNINNGAPPRKQIIKLSQQDVSNANKEERAQPLAGMNALLKPLDRLVGAGGTSNHNMSDMLQSAPSDANGDKEQEDRGKSKEYTSNLGDQHDENGSASVPSGLERSPSASRAQEKLPVVTQDLNLPAQDPASSKGFALRPIWFTLVASDKQRSYFPLPPIPPHYLMVKDPNMPASLIKKFLMKKLGFFNENDVELTLRGRPISPDLPLQNVVDMWLQTTPRSEKIPGTVGVSGKNFVMVVTYGRRSLL